MARHHRTVDRPGRVWLVLLLVFGMLSTPMLQAFADESAPTSAADATSTTQAPATTAAAPAPTDDAANAAEETAAPKADEPASSEAPPTTEPMPYVEDSPAPDESSEDNDAATSTEDAAPSASPPADSAAEAAPEATGDSGPCDAQLTDVSVTTPEGTYSEDFDLLSSNTIAPHCSWNQFWNDPVPVGELRQLDQAPEYFYYAPLDSAGTYVVQRSASWTNNETGETGIATATLTIVVTRAGQPPQGPVVDPPVFAAGCTGAYSVGVSGLVDGDVVTAYVEGEAVGVATASDGVVRFELVDANLDEYAITFTVNGQSSEDLWTLVAPPNECRTEVPGYLYLDINNGSCTTQPSITFPVHEGVKGYRELSSPNLIAPGDTVTYEFGQELHFFVVPLPGYYYPPQVVDLPVDFPDKPAVCSSGNAAPGAAPLKGGEVVAGTTKSVDVVNSGAVSDPDGDLLTLVAVDNAVGGECVVSDRILSFTASPDWDSFGGCSYTVSDGSLTATEWIEFVVVPKPTGDVPVRPASPSSSDVCGATGDTVTIPVTTGVEYLVSGRVVESGTRIATGTVPVVARAQDGYAIEGPWLWFLRFTDSPCTPEPVEIATIPLQITQAATGGTPSVTFPVVEGVSGYKVRGSDEVIASGSTVEFEPGQSIVIDPVLEDGYVYAGDPLAVTFEEDPGAPNQQPVAGSIVAGEVVAGSTKVVDVVNSGAVFDPDGDQLTLSWVGPGTNGSCALVDGKISYTPNTGYQGSDNCGYTVTDGELGATNTVSFTVVPPTDRTPVTPAAPSSSDACGTANDTVTIPATEGVEYLVNGVPFAAGVHGDNGTGIYTIVARALDGYVIEGTSTWSVEFTDSPCLPEPVEIVTIPLVVAQGTTESNPSITFPVIEGVSGYEVLGVSEVIAPGSTVEFEFGEQVAILPVVEDGYVYAGVPLVVTFDPKPGGQTGELSVDVSAVCGGVVVANSSPGAINVLYGSGDDAELDGEAVVAPGASVTIATTRAVLDLLAIDDAGQSVTYTVVVPQDCTVVPPVTPPGTPTVPTGVPGPTGDPTKPAVDPSSWTTVTTHVATGGTAGKANAQAYGGGTLPYTGTDAATLSIAATLLVTMGGAFAWVGRRRKP